MAEPFENECCPSMIDMKAWREGHEHRHEALDDLLDKVLNRLPLWATFLLTIAGGVIGSLLTVIGFLARH
jgi:hypothetical protein